MARLKKGLSKLFNKIADKIADYTVGSVEAVRNAKDRYVDYTSGSTSALAGGLTGTVSALAGAATLGIVVTTIAWPVALGILLPAGAVGFLAGEPAGKFVGNRIHNAYKKLQKRKARNSTYTYGGY